MAEAKKPVVFRSQYEELRLVKDARYKTIVGNHSVLSGGVSVQFRRNTYQTTNQEVIDWLRGHKGYGVDFHEVAPGEEPAKTPEPAADAPPVVKAPRRTQVHGLRSSATVHPRTAG